MTYAEVVRRIARLMYVRHEFRWADPSLKRLTGDFIGSIEEPFTPIEGQASLLQNYPDLYNPFTTTEKILAYYREVHSTHQCTGYTAFPSPMLAARPEACPIFISPHDESFKFPFKKDSLWQSKDLQAVVG